MMQKCSFLMNVWSRRSRVSINSVAKFSSSKNNKSEVAVKKSETEEVQIETNDEKLSRRDYRFIFPEFLPDPNLKFRNPLAEKLQRKDLLARRNQVEIPGNFQTFIKLLFEIFERPLQFQLCKFVKLLTTV